jgi:serine/threonine protein phosphatase PrpC
MYKFLTRICSETGRRENNEDECTALRIGGNTYLLAIADGIGGKEGGEIASKIVISSVSEYFTDTFKNYTSEINLKGWLEEGFLIAQSTIRDYIDNSPGLEGMGTTLTILLLDNKKYVWGNIGDSRLYLIQNDVAKLITTDHTHIAAYLKGGGEVLPQKVMDQYKNIITRIVDGGNDKPDIYPLEAESSLLQEDDIFLLCSDGLIVDKTIDLNHNFSQILKKNIPLAEISDSLIKWALSNGSDDNISVVLGAFTETNEMEDSVE